MIALILGAGHELTSIVDAVWQLHFYCGVVIAIGMRRIDVIALSTGLACICKDEAS